MSLIMFKWFLSNSFIFGDSLLVLGMNKVPIIIAIIAIIIEFLNVNKTCFGDIKGGSILIDGIVVGITLIPYH